MRFAGMANELLPVKDADRDQIRLLARREVVAVLRRERRSWVHTVQQEFATYYPLVDLMRWLGGKPFIQIGRHAVVNLQAIERITHYGDRLYRGWLRDRASTEITAPRTGAVRLSAVLKTQRKKGTHATPRPKRGLAGARLDDGRQVTAGSSKTFQINSRSSAITQSPRVRVAGCRGLLRRAGGAHGAGVIC